MRKESFLLAQRKWSHQKTQVSLYQNNCTQGFTFLWGKRLLCQNKMLRKRSKLVLRVSLIDNCLDGFTVFCSAFCSGLRIDFRSP